MTLIGKQFGRYEIRSKIGSGGMGEVYAGWDAQLNRDVALKILSLDFSIDGNRKSRFHREARAASALNHPNIITIYEIGENEHGSFLATELVDGETLREVIKKRRLSILQALKITEQIAGALAAAHEAHIVHRDIKPENIMVRRDGYVKVLDFGLAKAILPDAGDAGDENSTIKTTPGIVMGSVRYMSPEQARGQEVDGRTDVWSLGVVLYEMIVGRSPFHGATTSDTLAALIYKEPEEISHFIPNAPAELTGIINLALEKEAGRRYQSAGDFLSDVKKLIYHIEHEISLESRTQMLAPGSDISENPTMIHRTASANHPTHVSIVPAKSTSEVSTGRGEVAAPGKKWKSLQLAIVLIGSVAVLSALAFGLYRLFARGTDSMAANFEKTQISRLNSDGKVRLPAISPDAKYVAYVSGEVGNRSLVVRQLATDSEVTVVPATALSFATITFSPTGDYVYYTLTSKNYSVNTLYQVPTLGGASKKLIEDVDSPPTFAPDGKRLAFIRHASQSGEDLVFTASVDGSNIKQLISRKQTEFDFFNSLAWSPDNAKILIGAGKSQGGVSAGSVVLEVSPNEGSFKVFGRKQWNAIDSLAWLKDGSGFLVVAREADVAPMQVWRVAYPSGETRAVTNDPNNYTGLSLSADGSTLVTLKSDFVSSIWSYSPANKGAIQLTPESPNLEGTSGITQMRDGKLIYARKDGKEINLWASDGDGKNGLRLTSDARINQSPAVTPDGRYIIFNTSRSGTFRIWRMDTDGKNPIQLTEEDSQTADFNPLITPDGKSVIFSRNYISDKRPALLMKVSIEGGGSTPIYTDEQHSYFSPQLSTDGKHLLFMSYDIATYERNILVAAFDGNTVGAIEKSFESNLINALRWSPDGKSLTYLSGEGVPNLWRMPLDGTKRQQLTDYKSGRIFNYAWSDDGKTLLVVRGIVNSDLILIKDATRVDSR